MIVLKMSKKEKIATLYKQVFGNKVKSLNYKNSPVNLVQETTKEDKCHKCENICDSYNNRQDLPYFKSFEKVKTLVIAESPGRGKENGSLGYVFGWEEFEGKSTKATIINYENYFFNILNLNREETYITDGVKCYTPKNNFSKAFKECNEYLKEEIKILEPKNILVISKQPSLKKYLEELKNEFDFQLNIIPHPSTQNISKIKTVSEIFIKIGELNSNENWKEIGKKIAFEYEELQKN